MKDKDSFEKFDYSINFDKAFVDNKIISISGSLGWEYLIKRILKHRVEFKNLNIIEVGSGMGTFALTLAVLGARVTLLDADEQALEAARKSFLLYDCTPVCVKANMLETPAENLVAQFDIVISNGVIEHFTGDDREKVVRFHRSLLNSNGLVYIGVPNRISPFYRISRFMSELAGQWNIDTEIPYSPAELLTIAEKIGLNGNIVGNRTIKEDTLLYSAAVLSFVLHFLPGSVRLMIKNLFTSEHKTNISSETINIKEILENKARTIKTASLDKCFKNTLRDHISAGIIFVGGVK